MKRIFALFLRVYRSLVLWSYVQEDKFLQSCRQNGVISYKRGKLEIHFGIVSSVVREGDKVLNAPEVKELDEFIDDPDKVVQQQLDQVLENRRGK